MKNCIIANITVLILTALGATSHAQVLNPAFFSPAATSPSNPFYVTPGNNTAEQIIPNWTVNVSDPNNTNSYGVVNNSQLTTPGTSFGPQSAVIQVYYNYTYTTLTSATAAIIQPNTTYTLTVALGALANPTLFDGGGVAGTVGETAAQADISLLANGAVIPGATLTVANTAVPVGTLGDYTISFKSPASGGIDGEALTVQLEADKAFYPGDAADPGDEHLVFGNVRLVVPEPSTYALMLGGLGFLALMVRRKASKV